MVASIEKEQGLHVYREEKMECKIKQRHYALQDDYGVSIGSVYLLASGHSITYLQVNGIPDIQATF